MTFHLSAPSADHLRALQPSSDTPEHSAGYSDGGPTPKEPSVKVCPFCAEELPDEATVCSRCHKDPAAAPAWNVSERPDEPSLRRLGDAFGPDGVLPTSDRVFPPPRRLEPSGASSIPSKVWMSLTLALVPEFALGMTVGLPIPASGLPPGDSPDPPGGRIHRRVDPRHVGSRGGATVGPACADPRNHRDRAERVPPGLDRD